MKRYEFNTGTRPFGKFCMTSYRHLTLWKVRYAHPKYTPGTDIPSTTIQGVCGHRYRICSVRPQYPTQHSSYVRYELNIGTRHFGTFGTTLIPVVDTSVGPVRPQKITPGTGIPYRTYPWKHCFASCSRVLDLHPSAAALKHIRLCRTLSASITFVWCEGSPHPIHRRGCGVELCRESLKRAKQQLCWQQGHR